MNNKYYIGLDVGTNSVGWAVTNEEYDLVRLKGKHAWGSRIFSEAKDCKERRQHRSNRRRIARRKYRIKLLNEIFAEAINNIDKTFFLRLDNASYLFEDKKNKGISKNLIFKTREEEIRFYNKYPTIWHLRKALIEDDIDAKSDIRNVYMALHHIIKYRGNFLIDGEFNNSKFDAECIKNLNQHFVDKDENKEESIEEYISYKNINKIIDILLSDENKKTKQKEILKLINIGDYKEYFTLFVTSITGGTYSLKKIVPEAEGDVDFTKATFEENLPSIVQSLGEDFIIVEVAKKIYDHVNLKRLIGDEKYLSNVMVNIYDNHKKDLANLKKLVIDIDNNKGINKEEDRLYYSLFKDEKSKNNYSSFVHVETSEERQSLSDFNKYIEKVLVDNEKLVSESNKELYKEVLSKLEKREMLKIIANESTSIIPHQLHMLELEKIIDNCSTLYEFLRNNKEKLITLFRFRVHYYVGPLNDKSEFSNIERNSNEIITPWNFDSVVNEEQTRTNFMKKLTNSCSYLYGEKVMPKVALAFEEYLILDRLNVMLVNGDNLSFEMKEKVLKYLLSKNKVTIEQLRRYIGEITGTKYTDVLISNIKEDMPFEAKAHAHLSKVFSVEERKDELEYLIYIATVYADDKKSLKDLLNDKFNNLTEVEKKCILNLPTKKWATISYKLLNGIRYIDEIGRAMSILEVMKETNKNFQMVINDKEYNFLELIKIENDNNSGEKTIDDKVNELLNAVPSITRRSIHQTLLIIDDIIKASKSEPSKIFVEVTREDDEKKKGKETNSREKELELFINGLLKGAKNNSYSDINELKDNFELHKHLVKGKHLYLYFKQMGIDVYTGEKINIDDVINSTKYDIDHIIPQSLIKDDSLDNMVLVNREYNQRIKKDLYPIPTIIRNENNIKLWKYLREINSISDKKYNNLMRSSEISLEEIENFVARQINVVNYSNIALRNILNIKYPNTKVIFSKAQYPHHIRKELEIVKNRDVNDAHHAVDAYLNVVAGNILSTEFSNVRAIYERKMNHDHSKTFNMNNMIDRYLKFNNNELADKVFRNCMRRDALITFKVEYGSGALYKQTLYKRGDGKLIPIHTKENNPMSNTDNYGGYSSLSQAYLMAVQYEEKGKIKKEILRVPLMYDLMYKNNQDKLIYEVVGKTNAKNIKLITKIYQNQKIRYDGCEYLLWTNNDITNKYKMAYQNYLSNEHLKYLDFANKKINLLDESKEEQEFVVNKNNEKKIISKKCNKMILDELVISANKEVYNSCNYIVKAREISKEEFDKLSTKNQIETINNLIKVLSRSNEMAIFASNLSILSKQKLLLAPNILNKSMKIIYESPTGLFSHEVKI